MPVPRGLTKFWLASLLFALVPASHAETGPLVPAEIQVAIGDVAVLVPITEDLFVSLSGDGRANLRFRSRVSRGQAFQYLADMRGEEIKTDGFSYNFNPRLSDCEEPLWINRFCDLAVDSVSASFISRFSLSYARSHLPMSEVFEQAIALPSAGEDRHYLVAKSDVTETVFVCTKVPNPSGLLVCESYFLTSQNLNFRFTSFVREEDLNPTALSKILNQAQEIADGLVNGAP